MSLSEAFQGQIKVCISDNHTIEVKFYMWLVPTAYLKFVPMIQTTLGPGKGLHVVGRHFYLLLLNSSARPCLGSA